ncbi:MAG: ATP-binding cassette domain-containing protein [Chitinophagales bacterium]|jgi:phospholipid/cholesterol/gamma-HCH transport system ATP-binding protein|nr:ATP-binding cassette domain-containing protein [Bacteroidota bacterium]MBK9506667.1 ATP-binding cassette domain-containing protein [Bacteroidota bacterium]MBK9554292.1 ATP-binding cassette domain-containing protein [Bacteroidota bacterium]MBL0280098.1 ATP-binding cassette domain-containing protein [Bacteroidota bacterium]MBP9879350.1 ATP-binding cassette domain-containing protein [Chitinophagales bacterium]
MLTEENATINITGLSKSFGNLNVLSNIDLTLQKGEHIAVLGKSGSGKSVLIKIIAGLLLPDSGTVLTLGKNIATITEKEKRNLRLKIGFSFQNSALYDSMTVRENIEFPLVRKDKHLTQLEINKQVDAVLDAVGLGVTAEQMPSELSGGQRKRIGIARTLILEPELMLYDEPTAGLDPITCIEINNLIIELQKRYNSSAIIITHDLTCAKATANKVVVLLDGQFVRQGTFKEVFDTDIQIVKQFYDYNFII